VELDVDEDEALRRILDHHRRSSGWNDYSRIRVASKLREATRKRAEANQQAGGRFKASSKLTKAEKVSVRKEIAHAAGVSEGSVTKVAGSCEARRVQWHELEMKQTHRLFMATDPMLRSRCVFAYESKPRQPHAIWSLARITASSSALSGGFWKKATAPDSRERLLLSRSQPVRTITGITERAG
jgi:hypothetical protein